MKNYMKHITLGAVLGLAMMVGSVGHANALLLGEDIETSLLFPDTSTVLFADTQTVVDPGIEYTDFGNAGTVRIDFKDSLIKLTSLFQGTFPAADFNGLRFVDINNTIPAWKVSVNAGMTNVSGFVLTHTANEIFLNIESVNVNQGDMIALNVKPVPEPSTMLLLGTGLAGIVGWRARKQHA